MGIRVWRAFVFRAAQKATVSGRVLHIHHPKRVTVGFRVEGLGLSTYILGRVCIIGITIMVWVGVSHIGTWGPLGPCRGVRRNIL